MAIYFVTTCLIMIVGAGYPAQKNSRTKRNFLVFSFGILIAVAALRSVNVGTDLATHYARRYVQIASYNWKDIPNFSMMSTYELGYCYLTKFLSTICPHVQFYVLTTSIFTYGVTARFIFRNSDNVKMSTYVFILTCTYYNYMNIVRQAIAISIILLGYEYLKRETNKIKNVAIYVVFVLVASTIHSASILCLVFAVFRYLEFKRKHIFWGVVGTMIFYIAYQQIFSLTLNLFGLSAEYSGYFTKEAESVGHINKQSISMFLTIAMAFVIGCYTLVVKKRRSSVEGFVLHHTEKFLLYMGLLATICRLMVFRMNIINRYSYFCVPFVLLLYPTAINAIGNVTNRKIAKYMVYIMLVTYYIYMTFYYEASFHQTVPYEFFWQSTSHLY